MNADRAHSCCIILAVLGCSTYSKYFAVQMQDVSACKKEDRALRALRVKRPQQSCGARDANRPDLSHTTFLLLYPFAPNTHSGKKPANGFVRSEFLFPVTVSPSLYSIWWFGLVQTILTSHLERLSKPDREQTKSKLNEISRVCTGRGNQLINIDQCLERNVYHLVGVSTASRVPRASAWSLTRTLIPFSPPTVTISFERTNSPLHSCRQLDKQRPLPTFN